MESAKKLKSEIRRLEKEIQKRSMRIQEGSIFNSPALTPGGQEEDGAALLTSTKVSNFASLDKDSDLDRGQGSRRPVVKPKDYDGKSNFEDYKVHFELCSDINGWKEKEKLQFFLVQLQGEAVQFYRDMPDSAKADYQKVCDLFQVRFGSHGQKDLYRARLRIRKRKQGEPLVELAADIRRLINAAYPDMPPEVKNELGSDYFIEALDNAVQRTVVRRRKPTSLEAALKVAMEEEAIMQLEASRKGPNFVASTGETSNMQQMLNDLATQVSQLNDNVQQLMQNKVEVQGSHVRGRGCWNCGELGHFRRNCPQGYGKYGGPPFNPPSFQPYYPHEGPLN